jgi:type IV pilus assembly protein PilB
MINLTQQLVKKGTISKKEAGLIEEKIKTSGKREEEILLAENIVPEDVLFNLKSEKLKIPIKEPSLTDISANVLSFIPEDSAKFYNMVPLEKIGEILEVGMVYPEDLKSREALKFLSRRQKISYRIFLITPGFHDKVLKKYRTLRKEVGQALEELETEIETEKEKKGRVTQEEVERLVEEAPISKIVAVMLRHAVDGKASDIHIEPTREKLRVRFRLDGVLHSSIFLPPRIHPAVIARIKIISKLKLDETRVPQDGRFSTQVGESIIDFRVSTLPTSLGEKVAIRVLDPDVGMKTFKDLGLEGKNAKIVEEGISKPFGSILVTGPTGSGKTTTLYAIIQTLNKEGVNIITLEDPIEYYLSGINQSQMRPEIGYTFANGLRHVLRQDPDIIMVGEIRDQETASLSVHASLTGHIVLSTLHTNNATGVIPRLVDLGIESYLVGPTLNVAIAQRLVRKLCPHCRKKVEVKGEIEKMILKEIEKMPPDIKKERKIKEKPPFYVYAPQGCKKCRNQGYSGRVAVFEALKMTEKLAEIISTDFSESAIIKEAKRQGMITMRQDGIIKAFTGLTSMEEILRVTAEA